MKIIELLRESWEKDPRYQFHLSVEPNLIPGRSFAQQTRTISHAGSHGEAGGEGIYTTRNPNYWITQLAYEQVGQSPHNVYLVWVKEPSSGSVWAAHQDVSPPDGVIVLSKLMEIPDNDDPVDVGRLYWLADRYIGMNPHTDTVTEKTILELSRPKDIDAATRVLRRGGYQDITKEPGHTGGAYGEVYWRSDRPYVVKLFMATDEAYLRYLRLIQQVRSPHFPVLRGKPMRMNERYYAVRLERLTPLPANLDNTRYWMEAVLEYLAAGNIEPAKSAAGNLPKSIVHALVMIYLRCVKGIPTMINMSKYNVMVRDDGTIVIVDPIANPDD